MPQYAGDLSIGEARARYFAVNGLGDGGYQDRWVKLKLGPLRLWMPNTKARVAAVRYHDIHHVLTGYDTTWLGEAEIAAWEISSGCARHYAAWFLNLAAMAIGLALDFRSVGRAFWRGRRSVNLYREDFNSIQLTGSVKTLRSKLKLDLPPGEPSAGDFVRFGAWAILSWLTLVSTITLLFLPVWLPWLIFA
jgi:hypothetical protein